MKDLKLIGLYLIIDSIVSIYLASVGNITLSLSFISATNLLILSQFGRGIRLGFGYYLFTKEPKSTNLIGAYLLIDAICSIILANEFNSWDDYLRISRAITGGYLLIK